ncbi:MAG: hypothetical protein WAW41_12745 [Methylobacter sp.]
MALEPNQLTKGMEKIAEEIFKHCKYGKQSENLANGALACGQFYGDNVKNRIQRGLHGTSAAISILLASQKQEYVDIAKKLLIYTKNRQTYDPQNVDDDLNTIKQAETLMALNNLADDPQYLQSLKDRLLNKQNASDGSWSHFFDDNTPSEEATCYAVLSLHNKISPEKLIKSKEYLWKKQEALLDKSKSSDIYAIAIRSLILYTLASCQSNDANSLYTPKQLITEVKNLWNICRPEYRSDFEVTVEYYRKDKNQYLRLPWQIYLAHALLLTNNTYFYSKRFQRFLLILYQAAKENGGYKYQHEGIFLSTRTNAILYRFFDYAKSITPHKATITKLTDDFLEAWSHSWIRTGVILALGFRFLTWSNQWKELLNDQSPLWGDFIGALVISALSWLYSTGRR